VRLGKKVQKNLEKGKKNSKVRGEILGEEETKGCQKGHHGRRGTGERGTSGRKWRRRKKKKKKKKKPRGLRVRKIFAGGDGGKRSEQGKTSWQKETMGSRMAGESSACQKHKQVA